jgi:hypothetical protein
MPLQAKNWCFTLNNYTTDDDNQLQATGTEMQWDIRYLVYGRETGEKGTPHFQGYISFTKRKTFNTVKRILPDGAHIESAKGSPIQNKDYCTKDGDYEEFGQLPAGQGARTDLVDVAKACQNGKSFKEIAEKFPSAAIRYGNGIIRLQQHCAIPRTEPPELWCLWGKTGVGKTRRIWEFAEYDKIWVHPEGRWFDGYDGHPAVLFDDFDGSWFKITYLLKLIDRYPFNVPVKGAFVNWNPKVIYFTANHHPKEWYPQAKEEHRNALLRRFREFGHIQECKNY